MSSETGQIFIFDLESNSLTTTYTSHAMSVRSLAWSPDSSVRPSLARRMYSSVSFFVVQLLLSASEDKRLVLHDVRTSSGGTVASFSGHSSWVLSADISPDGRLGLSGCVHLPRFFPFLLPIKNYSSSNIASRSADKSIKVWDIAARAAVSTIQDTGEVWAVSWRPRPAAAGAGPGAFVSGGEDGVVRWWGR